MYIYPSEELHRQILHDPEFDFPTTTEDAAVYRFVATSEGELLVILRLIFAAEKTRQIIAALLAQSGVAEEELPF